MTQPAQLPLTLPEPSDPALSYAHVAGDEVLQSLSPQGWVELCPGCGQAMRTVRGQPWPHLACDACQLQADESDLLGDDLDDDPSELATTNP